MDVIANSPYDVRSQYGHLILVCLNSDEKKCQQLQQELIKAGYEHLFFPISSETLSQRDYLTEVIKELDTCSCLIPVIADGLFAEENVIYRNVFWFVIGYIQAKHSAGIVPFLADGDGVKLSQTPLKNANFAANCDEVIKTLETKYSDRLMKSHYYDNYLLNFYAYKRIMYRRVAMKCRIYEKDFRHICDMMEYEWGSGAEAKLDRFLANGLTCSYKVLSFGSENMLEPQFEPYRDEIHPNENGFSSSIHCKSSYSIVDDDDHLPMDVHAEIDIEMVVPVHKLFGVYFKCYISLKQKDYTWMLPLLFSRDLGKYDFAQPPTDDEMEDASFWNRIFPESTYTDFQKGRFYFSLGFERHNAQKSITLTPEMRIGKTADYIFPQ